MEYQFAPFTVNPVFCPVDYSSSETKFDNDNGTPTSAVTFASDADRTFRIFYQDDLSPVGVGQKVTVTATSTSIYGINNAAIFTNDQFDVIF